MIKRIYYKLKRSNGVILNPGDFIKKNNNEYKIKKTPYKYDYEKTLKFQEDQQKEYDRYYLNELNFSKKSFLTTVKLFKAKLNKNLVHCQKRKFKIKFKILNKLNNDKSSFLIDLNSKKIKILNPNKTKEKANLEIEIFSFKIANLIEKKYPMNFLTFHNGSIKCKRNTKNYSKNEQIFWDWIYNINFY